MILAEALILRADLDKSIEDIRTRLISYTVVQEGTQPPEDPLVLLEELQLKLDEYEKLGVAISKSNHNVTTESGMTLNDAITRKKILTREFDTLTSVIRALNKKHNRHSRTEILNIATIDVPNLQQRLEDLNTQKRLIEAEIQAANWSKTLITNEKAS